MIFADQAAEDLLALDSGGDIDGAAGLPRRSLLQALMRPMPVIDLHEPLRGSAVGHGNWVPCRRGRVRAVTGRGLFRCPRPGAGPGGACSWRLPPVVTVTAWTVRGRVIDRL